MKIGEISKRITSLLAVALVAVFMLPGVKAEAAKEYTVTFRPGRVGYFDLAPEKLSAVYGSAYTVTSNGAIKVTVPYGEHMPVAYPYVIVDEGYFVKNWGPAQNESTVEKNVDYVADYGKLVDGVEYTVKFVDAETKESVAPAYTAYANIGASVERTAATSIKTSANGVYHLQGPAVQSITLQKDAKANVIEFTYVNDYVQDTEVREVVSYEDGGVTTVTDTVHTVVNGGGGNGGAVDLNQDGGGAATPQGGGEDVVVIEDNDTPLADGFDEDAVVDENPVEGNPEEVPAVEEPELTTIEEEEVPLASEMEEGFHPMTAVAVFAVAAVIGVMILWLAMKRKANKTANGSSYSGDDFRE